MTRIDYPSDYHPLAPVIRQFRASLSWLNQSGVTIQASQVNALLQRLNQLPKTTIRDQRAVQIAQYWQQLPFASVNHLTVPTATHPSQQSLQAEPKANSTTPPPAKAQEGPLPKHQFPAVLHQRVVVESISFEQAPPQSTDMEGSAELMTPSQKLGFHRGLIQNHQAPVEKTIDQSSTAIHSNTAPNSSSSFFSRSVEANHNEVAPSSTAKPKSEQLWATRPVTASTPEKPQTSPKKREAFAKLQLNKSPSPKAVLPSTLEPSTALPQAISPLAHVRRTQFESDQIFGEICDRIWSCQCRPDPSTNKMIGTGHYGAQVIFVVAYASEQDLKIGHLLMDPQERNLFNGLLRAMSLSRLEIYLTSLMKCGSKEPKPAEWASCQNHFLDELQLIKPKIIVSLGYMASVMLLGDHARQGMWSRYQEIDVMPTFHPRDIIKGGDTTKRSFWNHLKLVMRKAGLQSSQS